MRDYAKVAPQFWTGRTGRALRKMGPDCQVVALYLITCPGANMIGLYYLPIPMMAHETGLSLKGASEALRRISEAGFVAYDRDSELVFVPEMARFQIGEVMKPGDNRIKNVVSELQRVSGSVFYGEFIRRYGKAYNLPLDCPSEAPPETLKSQEQEQDTEKEQNQKQEILAARPAEPVAPPDDPPVLDFPCIGGTWNLVASKLGEYQATYPAMDVLAVLRKARQWCSDNPRNQKTHDGMPRFLGGWLAKEQNRGAFPDRGGLRAVPPSARAQGGDADRTRNLDSLQERARAAFHSGSGS